MPKNKIVLGSLFVTLLFLSLNYSNPLKNHVLSYSNSIKLFFIEQYDRISGNIQRHFRQKEQIKSLQNEVETLRSPAQLSAVFATKLNQFLEEANLSAYNPILNLSRVIAYEELDNPFRMWIEYPNFDRNRSYGLVHKGFTAGIVYSKFDKALAHLQLDKRVVFSVLIGSDKLLGVLFGNEKNLLIKYIPAHANVKIGDEVVTSGSDNLFYEGIKVGKVVEIKTKNIYKIAIVEPYMKVKKPNFFYIVDLTQTIQ
jgi:rod shape-determining protein MreC